MSTIDAGLGRAFGGAVAAARPVLAGGCRPDALAEHLYVSWYGAQIEPLDVPADLPDDLGSALRAAHAGGERWEDGWVVENAGRNGRIVAARNGERRQLDRCDYVDPDRPGIVAAPGATVLAPARRDHVDSCGGWWYTHHEGWQLDAPEGKTVRIYWSIGPAAAPLLVRRLSLLFLDSSVPWMLKCALAPAAYSRADPAVLFVPRAELYHLRSSLDGVRRALSGVLRERVPPLTLRIGPGVGVADDPGTGESFGQHRCRLIAEGLCAASCSGGYAAAIAVRLREAGIPPDRPYVADAARILPWE